MPIFHRKSLEIEIARIYEYEYLSKLKDIVEKDARVVNFGCAYGYEALALMWILSASEVVGVNLDITDCVQTLDQIKAWLVDTQQALHYVYVSPENKNWWEHSVPMFLKSGQYPVFVQGDLSKSINIPSNCYSLAYCSSVLYQVFGKHGVEGLKNAVGEMKRVTKPNGLIVVSEPDMPSPVDATHIDFELIFSSEELQILNIERSDIGATYTIRKA